ncbi:DgyrCDS14778 [Dimorphilus gyrociliatus]|uniref:DgyrCDS14778 n=1 Tax=Dimorphilus gyrociliatus TaxID=2664684 RepID=A0A7I8WEV8_9ANNE|nr:DgyrCDS14778 [Dimorphilus gyrociliatus]
MLLIVVLFSNFPLLLLENPFNAVQYFSFNDGLDNLVQGVKGNAYHMSGSQRLLLVENNRTTCIYNPSLCSNGYSISVWLNVIKSNIEQYYISNGGHTSSSYGIAVVAVVWPMGNDIIAYIDGVEIPPSDKVYDMKTYSTVSTSYNNYYIGGMNTNLLPQYLGKGDIDELMIWDSQLTKETVKEIFLEGENNIEIFITFT